MKACREYLGPGFFKGHSGVPSKKRAPVAYAVRAAECPSRLRPSIGGPADVGAGRSRLARRLLASFFVGDGGGEAGQNNFEKIFSDCYVGVKTEKKWVRRPCFSRACRMN